MLLESQTHLALGQKTKAIVTLNEINNPSQRAYFPHYMGRDSLNGIHSSMLYGIRLKLDFGSQMMPF